MFVSTFHRCKLSSLRCGSLSPCQFLPFRSFAISLLCCFTVVIATSVSFSSCSQNMCGFPSSATFLAFFSVKSLWTLFASLCCPFAVLSCCRVAVSQFRCFTVSPFSSQLRFFCCSRNMCDFMFVSTFCRLELSLLRFDSLSPCQFLPFCCSNFFFASRCRPFAVCVFFLSY